MNRKCTKPLRLKAVTRVKPLRGCFETERENRLDTGGQVHRRTRSEYLDGKRMDAALELGIERLHHRAMLRQERLAGKLAGRDADAEMGLPTGARAGMTPVLLAFIDHFKMAGSEFDRKFVCNRVANGHMDTGSTGFGW